MTKANKELADPFKALKNIAFYRTGLEESMTSAMLVDYAKWQICKVRKVLWHDPIWNEYTEEEILTEFFCINFDLNPEARADFMRTILKPTTKDIDWFAEMEKRYAPLPVKDKIEVEPIEFDDKFV